MKKSKNYLVKSLPWFKMLSVLRSVLNRDRLKGFFTKSLMVFLKSFMKKILFFQLIRWNKLGNRSIGKFATFFRSQKGNYSAKIFKILIVYSSKPWQSFLIIMFWFSYAGTYWVERDNFWYCQINQRSWKTSVPRGSCSCAGRSHKRE